jgi:hypothetical protein
MSSHCQTFSHSILRIEHESRCQSIECHSTRSVSVTVTLIRNVVYSVPFQPERTENLVPSCKPVRDTPMFHLGQNFGLFRPVYVIRPEYFFGFFFFFLLLSFSFFFFFLQCIQKMEFGHGTLDMEFKEKRNFRG